MALKRGVFVVIEGADGTGKSTQVIALTKKLEQHGHSCVSMRFPERSTQIGGMIDKYLQCKSELSDQSVHLLFSANRWELSKTIVNTLQAGTSIICDRYAFSGVAYTSAKEGFSLPWCMAPDRGLPKPDKVLYLSGSVKLAESRQDYGTERYEKTTFQSRVAECFRELKDFDNATDWTEFNVEGGIPQVTDELYQIVKPMLECEFGNIGKLWEENS